MSVLGRTVFGEIRRQRSNRMLLIAKIDDKNEQIAEQNRRLQKRRSRYASKNNGKGRPQKKLRQISKDDEKKRQIVLAEIVVLDEVLKCPSQMALEDWLRRLRERYDSANPAATIQAKKIDRLLAQFCGNLVRINADRMWDENRGQEYLFVARLRQRGRLTHFDHHPAKTNWALAFEDRERTHFNVLNQFFQFSHLSSLWRFDVAAAIIRSAPAHDPKIHNADSYKDMWARAVDDVVDAVKAEFGQSAEIP